MLAWLLVGSQTEVVPFLGNTGRLDYARARARLVDYGLAHPEVWEGLGIIEHKAIKHFAQEREWEARKRRT